MPYIDDCVPDVTFAIAMAGGADVDRNGQASCYAPGSQEDTASLGNSSARFSAIVLDNKQEALERAVHECCVFIVPQVPICCFCKSPVELNIPCTSCSSVDA
jgi:hypothetical protein